MSGPRKTTKASADSGEPETDLNQAAETVAAVPAEAAAPAAAPVVAPEAAAVPAVAVAAAPVVAAAAVPVVAPVAAPAPEAAVPPPGAAAPPPPVAPAAPPPPAAPAGPPAGAQVAAAISGIAGTLKERLSGPEMLLGAGALLVFGASFLLFEFLLGAWAGPSEAGVIVSGLLLAFIGLERTKMQGFGAWYKVVIVLLGAILAMGAIYSLLFTLRHSASSLSGFDWLSLICYWIGGALAGAGSWAAYKVKA